MISSAVEGRFSSLLMTAIGEIPPRLKNLTNRRDGAHKRPFGAQPFELRQLFSNADHFRRCSYRQPMTQANTARAFRQKCVGCADGQSPRGVEAAQHLPRRRGLCSGGLGVQDSFGSMPTLGLPTKFSVLLRTWRKNLDFSAVRVPVNFGLPRTRPSAKPSASRPMCARWGGSIIGKRAPGPTCAARWAQTISSAIRAHGYLNLSSLA
jgi:hypothetical protein